MKKMMSLILALTMALSLTACSGSSKADAPADEKAFVVKAMPYNEFAEKIAQLEADGVSVLSSIRVADL